MDWPWTHGFIDTGGRVCLWDAGTGYSWWQLCVTVLWQAVPVEVWHAALIMWQRSSPDIFTSLNYVGCLKYTCLSVCCVSRFSKASFTLRLFPLHSQSFISWIYQSLCVCAWACVCELECNCALNIKFNPVTVHLSSEQAKAHMSWVIHVLQRRPLSCPLQMSTNPKQNKVV